MKFNNYYTRDIVLWCFFIPFTSTFLTPFQMTKTPFSSPNILIYEYDINYVFRIY